MADKKIRVIDVNMGVFEMNDRIAAEVRAGRTANSRRWRDADRWTRGRRATGSRPSWARRPPRSNRRARTAFPWTATSSAWNDAAGSGRTGAG